MAQVTLVEKRLRAKQEGAWGKPAAAQEAPAAAPQGAPQAAQKPAAVQGDVVARIKQRFFNSPQAAAVVAEGRAGVERAVMAIVAEECARMGQPDRAAVARAVLQDMLGYGPIQPLVEDPEVTDVLVNGPESIWFEKGGVLQRYPARFRDAGHVREVIEKIVGQAGRRVDESCPIADTRLPDGSRVNVTLPPVALDGPYIAIRKFRPQLRMEDLIACGTLGEEHARFLEACVRGRLNIAFCGQVGSGKTSLLNCASAYIPDTERVITIEDAAELQLQQPHVVRYEARPANIEGRGRVSIRKLVENALRGRPDRIIVGECRGAEALEMLKAMSTGHDGGMTTLHANNPRDMIARIEVMVSGGRGGIPPRTARAYVALALDLVVHSGRLPGGARRVLEISEIGGMKPDGTVEVTPIYAFSYREDRLAWTGYRPAFAAKLAERGVELPQFVDGEGVPA